MRNTHHHDKEVCLNNLEWHSERNFHDAIEGIEE